jgi:hypothetical protein
MEPYFVAVCLWYNIQARHTDTISFNGQTQLHVYHYTLVYNPSTSWKEVRGRESCTGCLVAKAVLLQRLSVAKAVLLQRLSVAKAVLLQRLSCCKGCLVAKTVLLQGCLLLRLSCCKGCLGCLIAMAVLSLRLSCCKGCLLLRLSVAKAVCC